MRMLMMIDMPLEPFNTAVRNGTAAATMKKILDDVRPEAVYFTELDGLRCGVLVVDVATSGDIPRFAEPWFLSFNAEVRLRPIMSPEDLGHADLSALGKKWS